MTLEEIRARLQADIPGCQVELVVNGSPSAQNSLLIDRQHGLEAARLLREAGTGFLLQCNRGGLAGAEQTDKVKTKQVVDGVEKEIEQTVKTTIPGYLEVVYHLFSMAKKEGPVVVRMRTGEPDGRRHAALSDPGLEERGISGARGVRPVRHCVRWASGSAAHPNVGGFYGLPHAQGLCSSA